MALRSRRIRRPGRAFGAPVPHRRHQVLPRRRPRHGPEGELRAFRGRNRPPHTVMGRRRRDLSGLQPRCAVRQHQGPRRQERPAHIQQGGDRPPGTRRPDGDQHPRPLPQHSRSQHHGGSRRYLGRRDLPSRSHRLAHSARRMERSLHRGCSGLERQGQDPLHRIYQKHGHRRAPDPPPAAAGHGEQHGRVTQEVGNPDLLQRLHLPPARSDRPDEPLRHEPQLHRRTSQACEL